MSQDDIAVEFDASNSVPQARFVGLRAANFQIGSKQATGYDTQFGNQLLFCLWLRLQEIQETHSSSQTDSFIFSLLLWYEWYENNPKLRIE